MLKTIIVTKEEIAAEKYFTFVFADIINNIINRCQTNKKVIIFINSVAFKLGKVVKSMNNINNTGIKIVNPKYKKNSLNSDLEVVP